MWFLFGEVSSSSGCLGWATLFYCGTLWAFHIIICSSWKNHTVLYRRDSLYTTPLCFFFLFFFSISDILWLMTSTVSGHVAISRWKERGTCLRSFWFAQNQNLWKNRMMNSRNFLLYNQNLTMELWVNTRESNLSPQAPKLASTIKLKRWKSTNVW